MFVTWSFWKEAKFLLFLRTGLFVNRSVCETRIYCNHLLSLTQGTIQNYLETKLIITIFSHWFNECALNSNINKYHKEKREKCASLKMYNVWESQQVVRWFCVQYTSYCSTLFFICTLHALCLTDITPMCSSFPKTAGKWQIIHILYWQNWNEQMKQYRRCPKWLYWNLSS